MMWFTIGFAAGAAAGAFIWHEIGRLSEAASNAQEYWPESAGFDDGAGAPFFYASSAGESEEDIEPQTISGHGDDGAGCWVAELYRDQIEIIGNREMDWEDAHETAQEYNTNFPGRTFIVLHRVDAPSDAADPDWRW